MTSQAPACFAQVLTKFPSRNGGQTLCSGARKGCRLPEGVAIATSGNGQSMMRRGLRSVLKTERPPTAVFRPRLVSHDFLGRRDQRNRRMLQESACAGSYETDLPSTLQDVEESNEGGPPYTQEDAMQSGGDGSGSTPPEDTRQEVIECYQGDGNTDCFAIDDWSKYKLIAGTKSDPIAGTKSDPDKDFYIPPKYRPSQSPR